VFGTIGSLIANFVHSTAAFLGGLVSAFFGLIFGTRRPRNVIRPGSLNRRGWWF
jgi:hypothetical protein